jgi:hypothetical protein|tara:strand:- start:3474 stop:3779 length:306 start_codon:yes stop_codon:yes gene_type:complete
MAEISTGTRTDVSSRDVPTRKDKARFSNVITMTGNTDGSVVPVFFTGSLSNSSGFIVQSAGNSVITTTDGGELPASGVVAKELYEIGVFSISGSGTISVVY